MNLYLNAIAQTIFDKKGFNILALDIQDCSNLTDYVLIAEGNLEKHVTAIAQAVIDQLQKMGLKAERVEGLREGDWVVIDYVHIMVHLFKPGLRDKYQLEALWHKGQIVDLQIDVNAVSK